MVRHGLLCIGPFSGQHPSRSEVGFDRPAIGTWIGPREAGVNLTSSRSEQKTHRTEVFSILSGYCQPCAAGLLTQGQLGAGEEQANVDDGLQEPWSKNAINSGSMRREF